MASCCPAEATALVRRRPNSSGDKWSCLLLFHTIKLHRHSHSISLRVRPRYPATVKVCASPDPMRKASARLFCIIQTAALRPSETGLTSESLGTLQRAFTIRIGTNTQDDHAAAEWRERAVHTEAMKAKNMTP